MPEAVVVGGGVMGLAAARALRASGRSVTLLERGQPGRAASWASAGIIGATTRDEAEADPNAPLRQLSHRLWPAFAEALQAESGLDPEYRQTGCLYLAADGEQRGWLERLAQRDAEAEFLEPAALRQLEPSLNPSLQAGLKVHGGNVEVRRLCRALELAVRRSGAELIAGCEARAITTDRARVTGVQTAAGHVPAELVVLAAGAWSGTIAGLRWSVPVAPQRGQILALDQSRVGIRHVLLTPGDPYFVPRLDGRLVVGATREDAGWDGSLTAGGVAWLLRRAMEVAPALADCPIAELWTGFRPLSRDGVPLIGPGEAAGLFLLTGHGPSGISPLPGSVALLQALIEGQPPPIPPQAFDPRRFGVGDASA